MKFHAHNAALVRTSFLVLPVAMLMCLRVSALAQRRDDPQRDTQIWPDTTINIKLRPDLSLIVFGTARVGRDDSALVSEQAGLGLSRSFGRHFSGTISYRYVSSEPTPDRQSTEHRIFLDLTPRRSLGAGFNVQDRNRIEWRDINDRVSWRYRNRLQFERPFGLSPFWRERKISPYVSGETMYDTRYHAWNRNQIYLGARVPITRHITFDGFYMKQWDARTRPGFLNVVGAFWRLEY